jgi:hypothetical protein
MVPKTGMPKRGERRGAAVEARNPGGARRQQPRLRAVRAAQSEVDQALAGRGQAYSGRLRRHHGLEVDEVEKPRLYELRLWHRRGNAQDRLIGKEQRALGHGVHVAGEAPAGEPCREPRAEDLRALDPIELLGAEAQRLQQLERLLQARGDEELPAGRKLAHEQLEHRRFRHLLLVVRLQHGELVQVGEQRAGERVHPATVEGAAAAAFDAGQRRPAQASAHWATMNTPLPADALRRRCDPAQLAFQTTAELTDLDAALGQGRAQGAIEFGVGMRREGYNLFAMGPEGIGRHTIVRRHLEAQAKEDAAPADWCYVFNFERRTGRARCACRRARRPPSGAPWRGWSRT